MMKNPGKLFNKFYFSVPDTIESLKFEDISDRSVRVLWSEPEQSNGILKGYTLTYMVKDTPSTKVIQNFTADVTTHLITDLSVSHLKFCCVDKVNYLWCIIQINLPKEFSVIDGISMISGHHFLHL